MFTVKKLLLNPRLFEKYLRFIRWLNRALQTEALFAYSELEIKVGDKNLGVVSRKMITNEGLRAIANSLMAHISEGAKDFENFTPSMSMYAYRTALFHNIGSGTRPESATETSLQMPLLPRPVRADQYFGKIITEENKFVLTSIKIFTFTTAVNVSEHGVWSSSDQYDLANGLFLDRSVFTPMLVQPHNPIQITYRLNIVR